MARYSTIYLLIYASVGVYVPWIPPLLKARGLTESGIALSLAAVSITRALFPILWGLLVDRYGRRREIVAGSALLSGVALLALAGDWPIGWLVALLVFYGFAFVPTLPLMEVLTFRALGPHRVGYGAVRLWGSIGFIATSLGFGFGVRWFGIEAVPWAAGLPLIAAGLVAMSVHQNPAEARHAVTSTTGDEVSWKPLAWLLLALCLGNASHGPYYAFFTLQMEARGVAEELIGALWAYGVLAEVVLMAFSARFLPRLGLHTALKWALLLTALRWALYAAAPPLWAIALGQTLHGASFGLLHLSGIQLVDRLMPESRKAMGQMLFTALSYGLGIGGGLALSGEGLGPLGYNGLYQAAAGTCGVAFGAAWMFCRVDASTPAPPVRAETSPGKG